MASPRRSRRLNLYAEAGADLLFADAALSVEEIGTIARRRASRVSVNMGFGIRQRSTTPLLSARELQDLGVAAVIYPRLLTACALRGMQHGTRAAAGSRSTAAKPVDRPDALVSFEELHEIMGWPRWRRSSSASSRRRSSRRNTVRPASGGTRRCPRSSADPMATSGDGVAPCPCARSTVTRTSCGVTCRSRPSGTRRRSATSASRNFSACSTRTAFRTACSPLRASTAPTTRCCWRRWLRIPARLRGTAIVAPDIDAGDAGGRWRARGRRHAAQLGPARRAAGRRERRLSPPARERTGTALARRDLSRRGQARRRAAASSRRRRARRRRPLRLARPGPGVAMRRLPRSVGRVSRRRHVGQAVRAVSSRRRRSEALRRRAAGGRRPRSWCGRATGRSSATRKRSPTGRCIDWLVAMDPRRGDAPHRPRRYAVIAVRLRRAAPCRTERPQEDGNS